MTPDLLHTAPEQRWHRSAARTDLLAIIPEQRRRRSAATAHILRWRQTAATARVWAVVAVMVLGLYGCSLFVPKLQAPRLTVVNVDFLKGQLWQQKLRVRMHVENPNDRVLPIKGITYTLDVNGQEFAHGETAASFVVPALGEAEFDMNMTANMAGTIISLLSHGSDASIDYHIAGRVSLSEGLLRSVPFDQHGTFKLQ